MPEGDTVWLAAERMRTALQGSTLTASDFRVPQLATTDLTGRTVLDVVPRGKHLLTRFDDGLTLHTHFRMDGTWHLYRPGDRRTGGPDWQIRVILENADHQAVGYRLPVVELLPTDREGDAVGHLGPDLLGPDWDADRAVANLAAQPDREIGMALLDQRNLAGLGNLYRTELCFLRGVSPWTAVRDVADLPGMVKLGYRLINANKGRWEQVTTGMTGRRDAHWVFERAGRPCRRCGTRIRRADQGEPPFERVTTWCPRCQLGPAPAAGPPAARQPPPVGYRRYRN